MARLLSHQAKEPILMNYKNNNANLKGRKAYNDGQKVIYLTPEDEIPEGFKFGGLSKRTHEQSV